MAELVKFCMVDWKVEEDYRGKYLEDIMNEFVQSGDIMMIIPNVDEGWTSLCKSYVDDTFHFQIKHSVDGQELMFDLIFSFKTYTASNQLYVEIMSDTYQPKIGKNKSYLEHLKDKISKRLLSNWEKCVWIYDKESEAYSSDLYPHVYETENLFRQLINEIMSTIKGANWWNTIVPKSMKEKMLRTRNKDTDSIGSTAQEQNKVSTYKAIAPTFKHVDEKLMLVEVGDLLKIATLKVRSLSNINSAKVNAIINGLEELDPNALLSELCNASTVTLDLWTECFSKYLSEDFKRNFRIFESNRNHIAHNKMIDKQAYDSIFNSINLVKEELKKAIKKFHDEVLPEEVVRIIELQDQLAEEDVREALEEIIEGETGVERRDSDEIYSIFDERLFEFYYDLEEALKFRLDIKLSDFHSIKCDCEEQELFTITYKIDNRCCIISCKFEIIDDSWGGSSEMRLQLKLDEEVENFYIQYQNGDYEYNYDQGYYLPTLTDEFDQISLDEAKDSIIDFIETNFENLREKADAAMYRIRKDGGNSPVANVSCCECGEEYISIDNSFAEYGRCLNCGEMNDVCKCEVCGNYYEASESDYGEDVPRLCERCLESIEEE